MLIQIKWNTGFCEGFEDTGTFHSSQFPTKIMDSFKILKLIHKSNSDVYIHTGGFLGVLPYYWKKNIFMMASDAWVDDNPTRNQRIQNQN